MTRLGLTAKVDNQKQVVNVNPINNINVSVRSPSDIQDGATEQDVHYPDDSIYVSPTEENVKSLTNQVIDLNSQVEAYKLIIHMFKENPIYINHLLLVDDEKLAALLKLMTNAESVDIDCEDIVEGCTCGATTYRKVNAIYVVKDGKKLNLKYDFPEITKEMKDLGINIKVVW